MNVSTETPITTPVAPVAPAVPVTSGTKSYLAMMTLAFFASSTGLARAYRGEKLGWIRFYIWLGALVVAWTFVPGLQVTAGLASAVLGVWGIVDFFLLYGTKTDADGNALRVVKIDKTFAKVAFVLEIVGLSLAVLAFILGLAFSSSLMNSFKSDVNKLDNNTTTTTTQSTSNAADEQKVTAFKAAYSAINVGDSKAVVDTKLAGMTASNDSSYTSSYDSTRYDSYSYKYEYTDSSSGYDWPKSYTISISYENDVVKQKSQYSY